MVISELTMTPVDWSILSKSDAFGKFAVHNQCESHGSQLGAVPSVTSKSSSSKSCTLPSIASTKRKRYQERRVNQAICVYVFSDSRLSTPSLSSSDGKGKRPLSFSPMSESLLSRSQPQAAMETLRALVPSTPARILAPLIEPNETQCQWSGCDLLFSTPTQLTEVRKPCFLHCRLSFSFSRSSQHIRSVHIDRADSRTWLCQWESCSRHRILFKSLYSLFLHLRTHTQDRPFHCTHIGCTKSFTRAEYLRLHARSHTGKTLVTDVLPSSNNKPRRKTVSLRVRRLLQSIQQCIRSNEAYQTNPSEQGLR